MKIKLLILVALFTVSSYSYSAESTSDKVVWSCHTLYLEENVLWLVERGDTSYIKVFDERVPAKYAMTGLEKRWRWGLDKDNQHLYEVRLGPDKEADYYDYAISNDRTESPKETYICSK